MKKFITLFAVIFAFNFVSAQKYEGGAYVGVNKIVGDVGNSYFTGYSGPTAGVVFKWNLTERFLMRANALFSLSSGSGSDVYQYFDEIPKFNSNLAISFDMLAEWNMYDFDPREPGEQTTYLLAGVGVISSNGIAVDYPVGIGYKYVVGHGVILGADLIFRYTSTDNLDVADVGNIESKDWFTTFGVTLTFMFGNEPCPCGQ